MNISCRKCGHLTIPLDTLSDQTSIICSFCGTDYITKPAPDLVRDKLTEFEGRIKKLEDKVKP